MSTLRVNDLQDLGGASLMGGRLLKCDVFTSQTGHALGTTFDSMGGNFTWQRPQGCKNVLVYVTGGGGGARANDQTYRDAGGGAGGTAILWVTNVDNIVPITWGAGGGVGRNNSRGYTGGTSSFGRYCSGLGGRGGHTDVPYEGGLGGAAVGGDINIPGGSGEMSHGSDREGHGGMSFWHKAGSNHHAHINVDIQGYPNTSGRWGSGGGTGYYGQHAYEYSNGGAGCVVVFCYS